MTVIMIESNSEEETDFLVQYANEHGMVVKTDEHRVLTDDDIVFGIGRRATETELTEYMLSHDDDNDEWISVETLKAQYSDAHAKVDI